MKGGEKMKTELEAVLVSNSIKKGYTNKTSGKVIPERYELVFLGAADRSVYKFYVEKPIWIDEANDNTMLKGVLAMDVEKDSFKSNEFGDAYRAQYSSFNEREPVEFASA